MTTATVAGGIYVATRALYPLLLGTSLGRKLPGRVYLSTFPGYAVIAYLAGTIGWWLVGS